VVRIERARLAVAVSAAWFWCCPPAGAVADAADISVVDDRGARVTLATSARRIVSLAPSITELVFAAGAGEKLVGVPRFSDYPAAAAAITQIGDATRVDLERVLSLQPDLVVAWKSGNHAADYERLEKLGFAVFVAEPDTLAAIPRVMRTLGHLAGSSAAAAAAADTFKSEVAALRARYGAREQVRVFYEIWHQPLMTVSGRHMISDVIGLCGGRNIFATAPALTPVVSLETVMALQPDVVLGGSSAATPDVFAAPWRHAERYAALRNVTAMFVDPDYIQRQTPRILKGAAAVCGHLDKVRAMRRAAN
jgi:iron complex transport system substrate-binding protein